MKVKLLHLYAFIGYLLLTSCTPQEINGIEEIAYIKDSNFSLDSIQNKKLTPLQNSRLGHKNGWYWFKTTLAPQTTPLILEINGNTIDAVEVFNASKKITDYTKNIAPTGLALKIPNSDTNTYYIKTHFTKHVDFPLKLYTEETYFLKESIRYLKNGGYYGFALMIVIVNLFFFFSLKEPTFLAYCAFVTFTNIGLTDYDGFIRLWFSSDVIYYISICMHFLVPLSSGVFASLLLEHYKFFPKSKLISICTITVAICFYIAFIITDNFLYFSLGDTVGLIFFTYYMYLGLLSIKKQVYAKFSVIGYSLVFISAVTFVLPLNWGIQTYASPLYTIKIGALFEMLILSYSITYRVKKLQEENRTAQNEINEYINKIYVLEEELTSKKTVTKTLILEQKIEEISKKHDLTNRESDVLLQIAKGLNNKQISEELSVSINTTKYHTRNLYEKLSIKKRTEITSKLLLLDS